MHDLLLATLAVAVNQNLIRPVLLVMKSDETSDETRRDRAPFQVETKFHKIHLSFRGHFSTRQDATRGKKRNFSSRNPPLEVFN